MSVKYPKRTLKKNLNREKLAIAAVITFSRNGYPNTPLKEVADHAGVHVQTLYKQFKNKEELAIAAAELATRDVRALFEVNFSTKSTFEIWRGWIESSVSYLTDLGLGEDKKQALHTPSSLMHDNYLLAINASYEDILTEYLSKDFDMDVKTERLPRLVACMLWSGNEAAMKRCAGLDTSNDVLSDSKAVIAESIAVVDDAEIIFSSYMKYQRT